jgi:LacI family transcriptional regulator
MNETSRPAQQVTIKDIAKKAGVSIATVSRVVNGKYLHKINPGTQAKVRRIIEEYKYEPSVSAVNLSKSRLRTIGMVFRPHGFKEFSTYFDEMIRGILSKVVEKNFNLMLLPLKMEHDVNFQKMVRSKTVSGLLLFWTHIDDLLIPTVMEENIPFVVLSNYSRALTYPYVDSANMQGASDAVDYLVRKGHARIGFISGSDDSRNAQDRFEGYKLGLKKNGLPFQQELYYRGSFLESEGARAMEYFLGLKERPTAVFSAGDIMAFGAIRYLKEKGLRVPDDIAVLGFDDSPLAESFDPQLSTIHQSVFDIGSNAADMLIKQIEGKGTPLKIIVDTKLVVRRSA